MGAAIGIVVQLRDDPKSTMRFRVLTQPSIRTYSLIRSIVSQLHERDPHGPCLEVTTHPTPRPDSSFPSRNLAEVKEPQGWVHHVADAATGKLLTTQLDRPIAPLSRAERLSRLGHQFNPVIFGRPTHRLTPRLPYQASPQGFLDFHFTSLMSSYADDPNGRADWLLEHIVPPWTGRMDALLLDAPAGRCLLTLLLGASTLPGQVGHIRIEVRDASGKRAADRLVRHNCAGG